jgi:WD40 repeat protein
MRRFAVLFALCFLLVPVQAQQALQPLNAATLQPLLRIGWGTPVDIKWLPDDSAYIVLTTTGLYLYSADNIIRERFINTQGHAVNNFDISPDGKIIATGGDTVLLWDLATGNIVDEYPVGFNVSHVAFSPSGERLVATKGLFAPDRGIFVYDVRTGRQIAHLFPEFFFAQAEFLTDETTLIAQQVYDCCGQIDRISIETGERVLLMPDGAGIQLTQDTSILFTNPLGSGLARVQVSETYTSDSLQVTTDLLGYSFASALTPDAQQLITLNHEGLLTVWDTETLNVLKTYDLEVQDFHTMRAAFNADATRIATAQSDGALRIVNVASGEVMQQRDHRLLPTEQIIFDTNRPRLALVTPEHTIHEWDLEAGVLVNVFKGHTGPITAMAHAATFYYSASEDGTVRRWDSFDPNGAGILVERPSQRITALALGANQDIYIGVCDGQGHSRLERLDIVTGNPLTFIVRDRTGVEQESANIDLPLCADHISYSHTPNSVWIRTGNQIHMLVQNTLDLNQPGIEMQLGPTTALYRASIYDPIRPVSSPDGGAIAVSAESAVLRLDPRGWSYLDASPVIATHEHTVTAFAVITDKVVVSAACNRIGYGWSGDRFCHGADMALTENYGGEIFRTKLSGHTSTVLTIIRHPRLELLASASEDGSVIIWGSPSEPVPLRYAIDLSAG